MGFALRRLDLVFLFWCYVICRICYETFLSLTIVAISIVMCFHVFMFGRLYCCLYNGLFCFDFVSLFSCRVSIFTALFGCDCSSVHFCLNCVSFLYFPVVML